MLEMAGNTGRRGKRILFPSKLFTHLFFDSVPLFPSAAESGSVESAIEYIPHGKKSIWKHIRQIKLK